MVAHAVASNSLTNADPAPNIRCTGQLKTYALLCRRYGPMGVRQGFVQVRFGEFVFDSSRRELTRRGAVVRLAPKAFDLLHILIEERPRAVHKNELRERLWPDVIVDEANLKNLVGEIRAALGDHKVLRTVQRFGYAFAADEPPAPEPSCVHLLEGDRMHRLNDGANVIGRDDSCTIILAFRGVSRHHAKITVEEGRCTLEDLGSKNGTFLNDVRLTAITELHDCDRIRVDRIPLQFVSSVQPTATRR
jgi:hypothetical protein